MRIIPSLLVAAGFGVATMFPGLAQTTEPATTPGQAAPVPTKQPPAEVAAAYQLMLQTVQTNDYEGFVVTLDEEMKAALTKAMWDKVVAQVTPRLKAGYSSEYFGELKKNGITVYMWRLRFKDGEDDILAQLSLAKGKVSTFLLL